MDDIGAGIVSLSARLRTLKYDVTLKTLLMDGAPALLTQLAGTSAVRFKPAEYPVTISRHVDLVGRIDGKGKQLLHTEVQ